MEDIGFFGIMGIIFTGLICIAIGARIGSYDKITQIQRSCEVYGKYVHESTTITCKETK